MDGVSFQIQQGKTLGMIGESGCGKSVTAQAIMGIVPSPPGKVTNGGEILLHLRQNGSAHTRRQCDGTADQRRGDPQHPLAKRSP